MKSIFSASVQPSFKDVPIQMFPVHKVTKNTAFAPFSSRHSAMASTVLPVVYTSSTTRILRPVTGPAA